MPKIIWLGNRHDPLPIQKAELNRLFPGYEIIVERSYFHNTKALISRYHDLGGDEMVALIPMHMLMDITKHGYRPIYSVMKKVEDGEDYDSTDVKSRSPKVIKYKFMEFVRLVSIEMKTQKLKPLAPV